MSTDDTTQPPQAQVRLLVNQHGLISGVRFTKQTPDVVFGDPEVVRIKPSGEVVIAEGANLDDAARAFWNAITEWRGDGSRPTLAEVRPGGRVRLGDAPWPEIDAILADAYSAGAEGLPFEGIARRAAVRAAVAALSAKPSPGGQGDALPPLREDQPLRGDEPIGEQHDARMYNRGWNACREAAAALAARQPAQQQDSVALGEATEFCSEKGDRQLVGQEAVVTSHWRNGRLNHILYCSPMPDGVHRLYAAPPAQAADLSQFRDALVWAEDAADCSSHPDHKAYRFAFTELLGMIDSQAVGNG
ncbi:hypothetical protein MG068_08120 [Stenotrophomonas sp. ASS1]|uniref:hypothetical protein n=1 Tax=Stenotrophomonas sp. ASS1 TaxID=2282124 RepID=UPI0010532A8D|nr:hypothetical protein [Stenotrophomonas sp. ASS1]QBL40475.1 hypothetical protein MG068_08120 [Stenotrophomonas sp. ASS1]